MRHAQIPSHRGWVLCRLEWIESAYVDDAKNICLIGRVVHFSFTLIWKEKKIKKIERVWKETKIANYSFLTRALNSFEVFGTCQNSQLKGYPFTLYILPTNVSFPPFLSLSLSKNKLKIVLPIITVLSSEKFRFIGEMTMTMVYSWLLFHCVWPQYFGWFKFHNFEISFFSLFMLFLFCAHFFLLCHYASNSVALLLSSLLFELLKICSSQHSIDRYAWQSLK